ncbi:bifunctional diaminohydroxyphosphoribosylaminopyrimidine deaminase/5-amino-6-(5-phosphoribosylamino)uracil reductase RibD [Cohnella caldifontis]|uniref:bifunctional diaminohydroxyphosphoribosylaminopyrimidine deaminase/5-amino-6-(5-phosphoribosylamino)uracil reductase RibD n=1 Tax=Cohnella caldifontis TaxID=3027471 RepID=UPI0023EB58C1|nr:bifunctional diaminohydroxyphosphoribosylaminopyrimidine deaminase/5-amino-6-(5-phosphoribosylamino)uracil reductase RibD [Cohnella sp. YIM B05605]
MELLNDEFYMRLALELAEGAAGQTGINPAVGCVVVKRGRIVGLGAHLRRGEAHAEVHALNMAGSEAAGSTVYVTLEPCSHHGRTPPCSDRLIAENVKRVVVAMSDPNPLVAGTGLKKLREHGIETTVGVLEERAKAVNEPFLKYITAGLPFVTLKTALTLDGRIATHTGHSRWVTGPEAREAVHTLRHRHQAIMVGKETALQDDPELTTRLSVPGLNPVRIVVDSFLQLPEELRIFNGEAPTWILASEQASAEAEERLRKTGAEIIRCGKRKRVDLKAAMKELGKREIGSVLLEGGGALNGAMLQAGLVDKVMLFYAGKIVGSHGAVSAFDFLGPKRMSDAIRLSRISIERYGDDWCVAGYPEPAAAGGEERRE